MTVTAKSRYDETTIEGLIEDIPSMESRTYRNDTGAPFTPQRVKLTLRQRNPGASYDETTRVEVTGPGFLKSGKHSKQTLGATYSNRNSIYGRDQGLDDMPEWLASWVQNAPDELKGDGDA